MYSTWNARELKEELKKRGASRKGLRADLIKRLELMNKNYSFGSIKHIEDPTVLWPPLHMYSDIDISTPLPPLTKMHMTQYLFCANDELEESKSLYESHYLLNAKSSNVGDATFVKGHCKKTMKGLHYEVDIKIRKNGTPEESHCDCPAGSGAAARCKHVAVLMYAVEDMANNKVILINKAAMRNSRPTHALKNEYTAIAAHRGPRKRPHHTSNPYPVHNINKEEYDDKIRLPLKQLSKPENPYTITDDHAHTSHQPENDILSKLKLISIDEDTIRNIEKTTRGLSGNAVWHQEQRHRLTASNFHKICHLKEATKVSCCKKLLNKNSFATRPIIRFSSNETTALEEYVTKYDLNVEPSGLFISQERPHLAASPDGLLGEDAIVEIRCPPSSQYQDVTAITVPYLIQDDFNNLTLKKTSSCYYQIQGELYCTGRRFCNLIIYMGKEIKVIFISRDENFINNMLSKLDDFYENYSKVEILKHHFDDDTNDID